MFCQDKYYHQILSSMPVALTKSDGFKNMDFSPKTISLLPEKLEEESPKRYIIKELYYNQLRKHYFRLGYTMIPKGIFRSVMKTMF